MSARIVSLRPGESAAYRPTIALPGPTRTVTVAIRLRWHSRIGLWAATVQTIDGRDLSIEQLVRPGGRLYTDIRDPEAPEGVMAWTGPDPYAQRDLGRAVQLWWVA